MLYLSHYVGTGKTLNDAFRPFGWDQGQWSAIDLRPDGGRTLNGGGLNSCLFWSSERIQGLELLGYDKTENLSECVRNKLNLKFGVESARTLQDAIVHLMTRPPKNAWNPVMAGASGCIEIWLGDNWAYPTRFQHRVIRRRLAGANFGKSKFEWLKYAAVASAALFPLGAILASDSFDRADDISLGANWTADIGGNLFFITSNAANVSGSARIFNLNHYNAITWPNNQYSKIIIGTSSTANDEGLGPATRATTVVNGQDYLLQPNTTRSRMFKNLAATYSQLGSDSAAFANGNTCELDSNGTSITALKNGSISTGPVTDTGTTISTGSAGMHGYGAGTAASWEGGDFLAGGGILNPAHFTGKFQDFTGGIS